MVLIAGTVWLASNALTNASTDLATKVFWNKMQYFGIVVIPPTWWVLALYYTGRTQWLTRRRFRLLSLVPGVTLLLVFTNGSHHLIWARIWTETVDSQTVLRHVPGVGLWVFVAYGFSLGLLGNVLIMRMLLQADRLHLRSGIALLVTVILILLAAAAELANLELMPGVDLTPFVLVALAPVVMTFLFRLRRTDLVPVARAKILESMADAVFVLDADNRLIDMNPAAQALIGRPLKAAMAQAIDHYWPPWQAISPSLNSGLGSEHEVNLTKEGETPVYDIQMSPLLDWRGLPVSQVVVWRDITGRKQAEVRAIEFAREGTRPDDGQLCS